MNTKEAIEFLKDKKYSCDWWSSYPEQFNKVIELLQRGEKMIEELKKDIQGLREKSEKNNEIDELRSFSIVYQDIERLEQKYFPKEK